MVNEFTKNTILIIKNIPRGKVLTYGRIAAVAGNPRGARQVTRILHSSTAKYDLPWHRVVNSKGMISFPDERSILEQRTLLESEGVVFTGSARINLRQYLWNIRKIGDVGDQQQI